MQLFTIGFTKTSADEFFTKLKQTGVTRLIDVRLNNRSQLAGFTKRNDLQYFAREICGIPYCHQLDLAPTSDMFDEYRTAGCQRRSKISPPGRSKTSPLNVMRYAVLGGCPGSP